MPLFDFRSTHLPYCLERLPDKSYLILNREYQPVGETIRRIRHRDELSRVQIPQLTAKKAARISYDGSDDLRSIYLYNDGCFPTASAADTAAYFKRLGVLLELRVIGLNPESFTWNTKYDFRNARYKFPEPYRAAPLKEFGV